MVDGVVSKGLEGGRHERRVNKMEIQSIPTDLRLRAVDPEIAEVIEHESRRQQENIELIASENFTSLAVMEAQGSVLTNKYAEGYPRKRWYGGIDEGGGVQQIGNYPGEKVFRAETPKRPPHSRNRARRAEDFAV